MLKHHLYNRYALKMSIESISRPLAGKRDVLTIRARIHSPSVCNKFDF